MNNLHALIAVWSDASHRKQAFSHIKINAQKLFTCKYPPVFIAMNSFTQLSELDTFLMNELGHGLARLHRIRTRVLYIAKPLGLSHGATMLHFTEVRF